MDIDYEYIAFWFGFGFLIAAWIYYDAKYRMFKQYPIVWAVASVILPLFLVVYLLYRKPKIKK